MTQGARPRILCAMWAALLITALMASGPAGAASSPAGRWAGEIETPEGKKAQIHLVLDQKDGVWAGSLEDPLLGSASVLDLKVTDTSISFKFQPQASPFAVTFSGSYVAGEDRVTGTFSMQGASRFVKFTRVGTPAADSGFAGAPAGTAVAVADTTPLPAKHPYRLAVTGRVAWWASLHSVKDEQYTMNNLTASAPAFDLAVKWFLMDGFSVCLRGVRGGQNMSDDPEDLAAYAANGLTADSYLSLDGFELGLAGYLGNKMMPDSKFNPYISGGVGRYNWVMTSEGRGTDPLTIDQAPLEATDLGGWFGLGTEYALNDKMALDFEWAWRFYLTSDTETWRDSEELWGNTMVWGLSAGFTYGF